MSWLCSAQHDVIFLKTMLNFSWDESKILVRSNVNPNCNNGYVCNMHCNNAPNNTVLIMILPVANPDLDLRGEGGGVGLALPAFLPSAIFPFFKQNNRGGGLPGAPPRSATDYYNIKWLVAKSPELKFASLATSYRVRIRTSLSLVAIVRYFDCARSIYVNNEEWQYRELGLRYLNYGC